ncbi:hypothetical protein JOD64_005528 [Micromonospora luteifusca]|uniref:Uncharacterized protein n=1 Tax=Micromonospora luteifusca TaxID=709860 RepID=A0ABS2M1H0_9ACTN|nr:hypothetical protein [Micromonospora luteifusca]
MRALGRLRPASGGTRQVSYSAWMPYRLASQTA